MALNQQQKDFLKELLIEEMQKHNLSIKEKFILNDLLEELENA